MRAQIESLVREFGLKRVEKEILKHTRNAIRLSTEKIEEDNIPLGNTKIGGRPDIPNGFEWPRYYDKILSFIAQINLSEIECLDTEKILPTSGILYFFYDCEQEVWGFDPDDKGGWKVIYLEENSNTLIRKEIPGEVPDYAKYPASKVCIKNEISLPAWESTYIDSLNLTEEEQDEYFDLIERVIEENQPINKILGHPDQIQGDMQLECQLVSNGLYCGDETGYESPKRVELEKNKKSWRLLFQIDSEENAHMMWGDLGRLYFWIKEEDLKKGDFDKAWMVLQCS